jgi:hypothetical protein
MDHAQCKRAVLEASEFGVYRLVTALTKSGLLVNTDHLAVQENVGAIRDVVKACVAAETEANSGEPGGEVSAFLTSAGWDGRTEQCTALSDYGALYGAIRFEQAFCTRGVQPGFTMLVGLKPGHA